MTDDEEAAAADEYIAIVSALLLAAWQTGIEYMLDDLSELADPDVFNELDELRAFRHVINSRGFQQVFERATVSRRPGETPTDLMELFRRQAGTRPATAGSWFRCCRFRQPQDRGTDKTDADKEEDATKGGKKDRSC